LLLHAPDPARSARYRKVGASVVAVTELKDYPAMAAGLSAALFTGERHVDR
jgi:hypothetical protein